MSMLHTTGLPSTSKAAAGKDSHRELTASCSECEIARDPSRFGTLGRDFPFFSAAEGRGGGVKF